MVSIRKATIQDCQAIADIGRLSVADSHRGSSSDEDMNAFLDQNYTPKAIQEDLKDAHNLYYVLRYNEIPVGFSKIVLNSKHPAIEPEHVTKLDRIYLLKDYYGMKLGLELLNFNIDLAKNNHQSGMWLYAWIGNERAVQFYRKAGFEIVGLHQYYVNGSHYDESHHMVLNFHKRDR